MAFVRRRAWGESFRARETLDYAGLFVQNRLFPTGGLVQGGLGFTLGFSKSVVFITGPLVFCSQA